LVKGCPRYGFPKKRRGSKPSKTSLPNSPHPCLQAIELLSTDLQIIFPLKQKSLSSSGASWTKSNTEKDIDS
jgi:hypothetical protein